MQSLYQGRVFLHKSRGWRSLTFSCLVFPCSCWCLWLVLLMICFLKKIHWSSKWCNEGTWTSINLSIEMREFLFLWHTFLGGNSGCAFSACLVTLWFYLLAKISPWIQFLEEIYIYIYLWKLRGNFGFWVVMVEKRKWEGLNILYWNARMESSEMVFNEFTFYGLRVHWRWENMIYKHKWKAFVTLNLWGYMHIMIYIISLRMYMEKYVVLFTNSIYIYIMYIEKVFENF